MNHTTTPTPEKKLPNLLADLETRARELKKEAQKPKANSKFLKA